ncbi:MAG: hypothetical protein ACYSU0_11565, partial [Planctomycetota bacterium]
MRIESYLAGRGSRWTSTVRAVAWLAVWCVALPAARAGAKAAGTIRLHCWEFDRGNALVSENPGTYGDYRDKHPELMLSGGAKLPWVVEYDVDFPVAATWSLRMRYASAGTRPLEVWLDGKRVGTCCRKETDNPPPYMDRHPNVHKGQPDRTWDLHGAEWEDSCKFEVTKGKHTLKLTRNGPPANPMEMLLQSPVKFPKGWKPAKRRFDLGRIPVRYRTVFLPADVVNMAALRLAIEDNIESFGPEYPKGREYLKRLAEFEKKKRTVVATVRGRNLSTARTWAGEEDIPEEERKTEKALKSLRREAMLDHPALKFDKLMFVKRRDRGSSVYTGHLQHGDAGGNLCVLSPVSPEGKVTELVPELSPGVFGRFDLSFDATKVVFSYCREGKQFRIYEIDIDPATGQRAGADSLRQLTSGGNEETETMQRYKGVFCGGGFDDIDPCYLPSGKIMFASTRSKRSVLCFPATVTTLHVMDADGKNVLCISRGQVNEINPCVMDDGRVMYMRWEYIDKGFG